MRTRLNIPFATNFGVKKKNEKKTNALLLNEWRVERCGRDSGGGIGTSGAKRIQNPLVKQYTFEIWHVKRARNQPNQS